MILQYTTELVIAWEGAKPWVKNLKLTSPETGLATKVGNTAG